MIFLWPRKTVSVSVCYLFYQRSKHGLFVFPNACGEDTVRLAKNRKKKSSFFTRAFAYPTKSHERLYPFDEPIKSLYFVCLLFLFCSRVFISRSDENRSQKTVNVYTADVTHLKGRRHAICYLFERDKQSPRINWFPKIMVHFFFNFFRLYDIFRHWKRYLLLLQRVGKEEPTFSSFNAIHQKLLWLVGSLMKFVWYLLYNSTGTFLCMATGTN